MSKAKKTTYRISINAIFEGDCYIKAESVEQAQHIAWNNLGPNHLVCNTWEVNHIHINDADNEESKWPFVGHIMRQP